MCGICGLYRYASDGRPDPHTIESMVSSIVHRGPDGSGTYLSPKGCDIGTRRLAIIDIEDGHQPMSDAAERIWVSFNGEIYNFPGLRRQLQARGHDFRTRSDTEVIVHGYREWGDGVLTRLNGMFGLAIWDEEAERLLLARDRVGIKCVYYHDDGETLLFGSEIRALRAALGNRLDVSPLAISLFLRYRYTPSPLTPYAGIRKLPAGSCLVVEKGKVSERRWWGTAGKVDHAMTEAEAVDQLTGLYREAVERQLISDVPQGLLLSGGVDSALLLALMNEHGGPWPTYTVGFNSTFIDDELADAAASSSRLGGVHQEARLSRQQFEASLPRVVRALEEPVATASIVPMYHLCARVADDIKVALVGQGPDELFGGYTRHLGLRYGHWWRRLPGPARGMAKRAAGRVVRSEAAKRAFFSLDEPCRIVRYQLVFSLETAETIKQLFQPGLLEENAGDEIFRCWGELAGEAQQLDELGGFQFLEMRSSFPDELMVYADKLSMAHGLELRVPYADHQIVDFAETIPDRIKVSRGHRKRLHKAVAGRFVPREILARKKRAFSHNVVDDWFSDSIRSRMTEYLVDSASRMYAFLDHGAVNRLLGAHQARRGDHHKLLFSLVVLEEWMRQQ